MPTTPRKKSQGGQKSTSEFMKLDHGSALRRSAARNGVKTPFVGNGPKTDILSSMMNNMNINLMGHNN